MQNNFLNLNAPKDISDEIVGAGIQLSHDAAYTKNVYVVCYFSCAFLLCVKDELIKRGIYANVLNSFIGSLDNVFPEFERDLHLRERMTQTYNVYLSFLSSMSPEDYVGKKHHLVFGLANQQNAKYNPGCPTPSIEIARQAFSEIAEELSVNISYIFSGHKNPYGYASNIPDSANRQRAYREF